jgi:hypothetical protein
LIFVDEAWAKTNMTPIRGWCPRGDRLIAKVPHGYWKTLTFIAGLRADGICAPCVLDGPINGRSFLAWVEQCLVPTLRHGDIVVLDNLGSHKNQAVRQANPQCRCQINLSAALQPRSEPHRASVRQAQDAAPQNPNSHRRRHMERHWNPPQRLLTSRMRQLPQEFRLCVKLKISAP